MIYKFRDYTVSFLFLILLSFPPVLQAESYKINGGKITFISSMDEEKITGGGSQVSGTVDLEKNKIEIKIDLGDWSTGGKLQTMHLHEDYLETEEYPVSRFTGEIIKDKNGYTASGILELHGVKKNVTVPCMLDTANGSPVLTAAFVIKLTDYNIKIPSLLTMKVNNEISVRAEIQLRKK